MVAPHHPPTMLIAIVLVIGLIIALFFSRSCARLMKAIPQEHRTMSAGLCWLMWIPAIGYIFQWMMLPFGVPLSLKKAVSDTNTALLKRISTLKILGLILMIIVAISGIGLLIFGLHSAITHNQLTTGSTMLLSVLSDLVIICLWITYWIKLATIKRAVQPLK